MVPRGKPPSKAHLARDGLDFALVGWQRALRHHALEVVVVELRVRQLECVERVVRRCERPGDPFLTQLRTAHWFQLPADILQVTAFCGGRSIPAKRAVAKNPNRVFGRVRWRPCE